MKVMTVLGTRPEIIRLSRVIEKLDGLCEHTLVHTGQNFDANLSDIFFQQLRVRPPDVHLGVTSKTFGQQISEILGGVDRVLTDVRPDRLLILGDTNSGLCSLLGRRMGIPVYHMEAGNRCYDDRVPEEINRRVIDHSSLVLMPYTRRSKENLLREGIPAHRIHVTGNPIHEVIRHHEADIGASDVHARLKLEPGRYFLVTMHRAENVDPEDRLRNLALALAGVQRKHGCPLLCSLHPHTRDRMERYGIGADNPEVRFVTPLGFFDFVALEREALCVLSDSGTVQEECCILHVPAVTIRDVTERPETIECGSNMLSGCEPAAVLRCVEAVLAQPRTWTPPPEYLEPNVSSTVVRILMGYLPSG